MGVAAGWLVDPGGAHELRYWDETAWTHQCPITAWPPSTYRPNRSPGPPVDVADQLRKLAALRDEGILSDEEFAAQKARVLSG